MKCLGHILFLAAAFTAGEVYSKGSNSENGLNEKQSGDTAVHTVLPSAEYSAVHLQANWFAPLEKSDSLRDRLESALEKMRKKTDLRNLGKVLEKRLNGIYSEKTREKMDEYLKANKVIAPVESEELSAVLIEFDALIRKDEYQNAKEALDKLAHNEIRGFERELAECIAMPIDQAQNQIGKLVNLWIQNMQKEIDRHTGDPGRQRIIAKKLIQVEADLVFAGFGKADELRKALNSASEKVEALSNGWKQGKGFVPTRSNTKLFFGT